MTVRFTPTYQPTLDELNGFVVARAKIMAARIVNTKGPTRGLGPRQEMVLRRLRQIPLTLLEIRDTLTFGTTDETVDLMAGLLARGRIQPAADAWTAAKVDEVAA